MNTTVRNAMKECHVKQWQVAAELGISENTMVRLLRFPLSEEKEAEILDAVKIISERRIK